MIIMVGTADRILSQKLATSMEGKKHQIGQKQWEEIILALGEVAAGIAHEIRNPLTGIKGFSQLLRQQFEKGGKEWQYINRILKETEIIENLIEEFLLLTKPTFPKKQWVHLSRLVDEILPLLAKEAVDNRVQVITKFEDTLAYAKVDLDQMRIALYHLGKNLIKAMAEGTVLFITVESKKEAGCNEIIFKVCSNEKKDFEKKIFKHGFDAFECHDSLSIGVIKRIIENHHGDLIMALNDDNSRVVVKLPFND